MVRGSRLQWKLRVFSLLACVWITAGLTAGSDTTAQPVAIPANQAGDTTPAIRFGPLQFGMGLEQIQAAIPAARWEITSRSKFTDRVFNVVVLCRAGGDPVDPAIANVAGRYAGAMVFDMSSLDRDDPQAVLVEIPVRVARSDVRPLTFSGTPVRMSDVAFDAVPPPREIQNAFPYRALRDGIGAEVEAVGEVQRDGSLVCRPPTVRQTDGAYSFVAAFQQAVEKLLASYRVSPTLKNGTPSAGAVFGMGVSFKVAE